MKTSGPAVTVTVPCRPPVIFGAEGIVATLRWVVGVEAVLPYASLTVTTIVCTPSASGEGNVNVPCPFASVVTG